MPLVPAALPTTESQESDEVDWKARWNAAFAAAKQPWFDANSGRHFAQGSIRLSTTNAFSIQVIFYYLRFSASADCVLTGSFGLSDFGSKT